MVLLVVRTYRAVFAISDFNKRVVTLFDVDLPDLSPGSSPWDTDRTNRTQFSGGKYESTLFWVPDSKAILSDTCRGKSDQVFIWFSVYGYQPNLNKYARICTTISEEIIYFAKHEQTCNERVILYKELKMYYKYNWACVISIRMNKINYFWSIMKLWH